MLHRALKAEKISADFCIEKPGFKEQLQTVVISRV